MFIYLHGQVTERERDELKEEGREEGKGNERDSPLIFHPQYQSQHGHNSLEIHLGLPNGC